MSEPLQGKTAIVTGAGRGIGRALALGFARAGANICCSARTSADIEAVADEIRAGGGQALPVVADVRDLAAVEAMTRAASDTFGQIDIVIVNAGVNPDQATIFDSNPAAWVETIQINLIGAYYCIKAAVPYLRDHGGHIITIGSGRGHRPAPGRSAYGASKAGLHLLMQVVAEELWQHRICVNEMVPGPVDTEMLRTSARLNMPGLGFDREWRKTPEDVVPLTLWIAGQDPAIAPTGQTFSLMRRESI